MGWINRELVHAGHICLAVPAAFAALLRLVQGQGASDASAVEGNKDVRSSNESSL